MRNENLSSLELLKKLNNDDIFSRCETILFLLTLSDKLSESELQNINDALLEIFFNPKPTVHNQVVVPLSAFASYLPRFNNDQNMQSIIRLLIAMLPNTDSVVRHNTISILKTLSIQFKLEKHIYFLDLALTQLLTNYYLLTYADAIRLAPYLMTGRSVTTVLNLFSSDCDGEMCAIIYAHRNAYLWIPLSLFDSSYLKRLTHVFNAFIELHYLDLIKNKNRNLQDIAKQYFLLLLKNVVICKKNVFSFFNRSGISMYSTETDEMKKLLTHIKKPEHNAIRQLLAFIFGNETFSNATCPDTTSFDLIKLAKMTFDNSNANTQEMRWIPGSI
ncbi:MAG: hypothetical protein ACD_29C00204G0002 [uncultured bacterium]|nr:MAG: hypothetical protein ACD_29C00204G0002 [uncultured bacterium]OGT26786.1 MAG: hypothetical protein A3B71_04075 [Gammaproteobacteria bacterium RIFCSPHIGHO2_02_FULL_42_43]OGT28664.1 MAG: hypothetical protein A2624_06725 [Gammaproteobacteria bacterium RIFCSPHIGHO2_01_FULL_42_8]OGT52906.1 MAG: hypothetical protein A3E54_07450 [Gammaproteobacteria bacterium RIFCSPHIGHO2_12_FULL_41_25]OGT61320.1 MAG: hypothetical protein A3I77_08240 [Gammaproteobacteria bacterium RIFCSPLOWO2_02_FULL_42_14]OGT